MGLNQVENTFVIDSQSYAKRAQRGHKSVLQSIRELIAKANELNIDPDIFFVYCKTTKNRYVYNITELGCNLLLSSFYERWKILVDAVGCSKVEEVSPILKVVPDLPVIEILSEEAAIDHLAIECSSEEEVVIHPMLSLVPNFFEETHDKKEEPLINLGQPDNVEFFMYSDTEVRVALYNGIPWWVAKDLCIVLGVEDTSNAVNRLDADEKALGLILTPGGQQSLLLVNEFGTNALVLTSRKPEVKVFKRWLVHEVIPAVTKNGMYFSNVSSETQIAASKDPIILLRLEAIETQSRITKLEKDSLKFWQETQDLQIATRKLLEETQGLREETIGLKGVTSKIKECTESILGAIITDFDTVSYKRQINNIFNTMGKITKDFEKDRSRSYAIMYDDYHINLTQRLRNKRDRMRLEGAPQTKLDTINKLDIIAENDVFMRIYKEIVEGIFNDFTAKRLYEEENFNGNSATSTK